MAEAAAEGERASPAEADKVRKTVEAEAQKLLYEASKTFSPTARATACSAAACSNRIEGIVRESVKPMGRSRASASCMWMGSPA